MRAFVFVPLVLAAALAFAGVARADDGPVETVDRNGTRWRWVPPERTVEERVVTIPGWWEWRREDATEPGRWETRTRYLWRPGCDGRAGAWDAVVEHAWVPPVVRVVERWVWIPERVERRAVVCERPGRWVRVCEPVPDTIVVPIPLPVRAAPAPAPRATVELYDVGPDLRPRLRARHFFETSPSSF